MPSTAESATGLLNKLSDEELARYGDIARDQATAELSRWWVQAGLALGALALVGWTAVKLGAPGWLEAAGIDANCVGRCTAIGLGLALLLGYWPYRRVKNWTLWNQHCKAVQVEQERRQGPLQKG